MICTRKHKQSYNIVDRIQIYNWIRILWAKRKQKSKIYRELLQKTTTKPEQNELKKDTSNKKSKRSKTPNESHFRKYTKAENSIAITSEKLFTPSADKDSLSQVKSIKCNHGIHWTQLCVCVLKSGRDGGGSQQFWVHPICALLLCCWCPFMYIHIYILPFLLPFSPEKTHFVNFLRCRCALFLLLCIQTYTQYRFVFCFSTFLLAATAVVVVVVVVPLSLFHDIVSLQWTIFEQNSLLILTTTRNHFFAFAQAHTHTHIPEIVVLHKPNSFHLHQFAQIVYILQHVPFAISRFYLFSEAFIWIAFSLRCYTTTLIWTYIVNCKYMYMEGEYLTGFGLWIFWIVRVFQPRHLREQSFIQE